MEKSENWGDVEDEIVSLPPPKIIGPDKDNVKAIVSYELDDNNKKVKVTRKYKVKKKVEKVSKYVIGRRSWKNHKYGEARSESAGPNDAHTTVSTDEIRIELLKKEEEEANQPIKVSTGEGGLYKPPTQSGLRTGLRRPEGIPEGGANSYKYKPGSNQAGESSGDGIEKSTTLRITNLTSDTTEQDVRALCSQYGRLSRVFLAWDRDTQRSKGFAYVSFYNRKDAEQALNTLDRAGYNHVILHVEWAKPNKRDDVSKQNILSRGHVSGYGGALPQGLTTNRQ